MQIATETGTRAVLIPEGSQVSKHWKIEVLV